MANRLSTIEESLSMILGGVTPLPAEPHLLAECLGMVTAEELRAAHDLPPFDNSAMDGYAVLAADTLAASADTPVALQITETIAAGKMPAFKVGNGQAAKIMTGAPLPTGADAVVPWEMARESGDQVLVLEPAKPGMNVRPSGGDMPAGTLALPAGTVLGPAEIGLVAGLGRPLVLVHRRPRVAIVSTGSELVDVGLELGPGRIYNSNGYALRALCKQLGVEAELLGIAADDRAETKRLLSKGLEYDVLLTSGGVSAGEFDFVKEIQTELGVERVLWGVAIKPGKPLWVGRKGVTLVFGLPGNPASAMVSFELFVRPALRRLMGHSNIVRPTCRAVIGEDQEALKDRTHAVRVRVTRDGDALKATSTGDQGSGRLHSMVGANGLVLVPPGSQGYRAGDIVEVLMLGELSPSPVMPGASV